MKTAPRHSQSATTDQNGKGSRGIPVNLEDRILLDLEDPKLVGIKFSTLCKLRPEYRSSGNPAFHRAIQNKVYNFKLLKRKNFDRYWKLYTLALSRKPADDKNIILVEGISSFSSDDKDPEPLQKLSNQPSTSSMHSSWASPRPQKSTPTTSTALARGNQQQFFSSPQAIDSSPASTNMSSVKKKSLSSGSRGHRSSDISNDDDFFSSFEEAEAAGELDGSMCKALSMF